MRLRAALAAIIVLLTTSAVVVEFADEADGGVAVVAPRVVPDPEPSHRLLAEPQDAATPDPAPVVRTASPVTQHTAAPRPTPKPKPKPHHVTVTRITDRGWAAGNWGRFSAAVQRTALCIAHHESWNLHNGRRLWTALNLAGSTASGFAQWIDSSWREQARRARVGMQYARAYLAPPPIQAAVFAHQMTHYGIYPWKGTHC